MKTIKSALKPRLASVSVLVLVSLLAPLSSMAQTGVTPPPCPPSCAPLSAVHDVPNVVNPNENEFQRESHFLTFIGSYIPETADSARAYYKAIDPYNTKPTFADWLKNAGFISDKSQWHAYGPQIIKTGQPTGPGAYGDNIINADSHVIVLNAADLGFVRNQFIRCKPSCAALNPIIYTYLENYPVAPFAGTSGFPAGSGYPNQSEATAAINSAINRPLGQVNGQSVERIADVAFEWAPPATNPNSSTRFGQQYAYIFAHTGTDQNGNPIIFETTDFPARDFGKPIIDFKAGDGSATTIKGSPLVDKFAPNLDGVGFKQHPGVCLVCHGGAPTNLTSTGAYPRQGNINGFRFLPLDNANLLFTYDGGPLTQAAQEVQIKQYNKVVLLTVPRFAESDGTGAVRVAHLREVIQGWYAVGGNYSDDTTMSSNTQNGSWIPKGWREAPHGTAPVGSEKLYKQVVGPSCRTCHFNRELSLDFGTAANFRQESDIQQLALLAKCKENKPDPKAKFMPLALLTFVRFWQTQGTGQTLSDGTFVDKAADQLATYFGYNGVAGYCATNP